MKLYILSEIIASSQGHNQEILWEGEVTWNNGTSINVFITYERKGSQEKILSFPLDTLLNSIVNEKFNT